MSPRLAVLALLVVAACRPTTSVEPESEFTLAVGENAQIAGTNITLAVERVANDSRCPSDAVCVWAGNAAIHIRARPSGDAESVVTLNTTTEPRSAPLDGYTLSLIDLTPYPESTTTIRQQDYRVRLRLSR